MSHRVSRLVALLALVLAPSLREATAPHAMRAALLTYQAPRPDAVFVKPATTLGLRLDGPLDLATLTPAVFEVIGSASGSHGGQTRLALDGATALYIPDKPFAPGETVGVTVRPGLATYTGAMFAGTHYTFTVSTADTAPAAIAPRAERDFPAGSSMTALAAQITVSRTIDPRNYVTVPDTLPPYTVTGALTGTVTETFSLAMRPWAVPNAADLPTHLLLVDGTGEPVYYQALPAGSLGTDFKRQPDGRLSYFNGIDHRYHLADHTYTEVRSVGAGNGYIADEHELQILPNGNALLMIYDYQPMDLSQVVPGGIPTATVIGLVVQSIDPSDNVVFEWRSWDHFLITDTVVPLTTAVVDYVHGNAIALDADSNLLISSRHLDEVTKIDFMTGDLIWRWGGMNNEFTLIGDPDGGFYHQHDIRRLPNGLVTLFDNHNVAHSQPPLFSRAATYALNEVNKTATLVSEYRRAPDTSSPAMGSFQVLADGGSVIGWGAGFPTLTELLPNGETRLELRLDSLYRSYRALRFPWAAVPSWPPTLVLTSTLPASDGGEPALYFSWNGATGVGAYEVYAGFGTAPGILAAVVPRTGFEDHVALAELGAAPSGACAFRIRALDREGVPLAWSPTVTKPGSCVPPVLFPLVLN